MPGMRAILDWGDTGEICSDDFFLKIDEHPGMYQDAERLYKRAEKLIKLGQKPEIIVPPVIEQLSTKGLSLLSYLYSKKDKEESQPVIASTVQSFEDIASLMESAPAGIAITVIFQPTDIRDREYEFLNFSSIHKTVCRFEKTENGLRVFQVDSVNSETNLLSCKYILQQVLKNGFEFFIQKNIDNSKGGSFSRQANGHQCGVFAIKDARKLSKDSNFSQNIIPSSTEYELPSAYFKGVQSNTFFSQILSAHGDKVVNRAGNTLQEIYDQHGINYIQYTNEKHNARILAFLEEHKDNPEYIKECVEKYSTEKMTMERLIDFYSSPKAENQVPTLS